MKLELLNVYASNAAGKILGEPDASRIDSILIRMLGESGEVYHFHGSVTPGQRIEDMLTFLSDEIRSTRRRKARSTYKVKSLMPKTWGKIAPHTPTATQAMQALSAPILSSEAYKLPKKPAKRKGKR